MQSAGCSWTECLLNMSSGSATMISRRPAERCHRHRRRLRHFSAIWRKWSVDPKRQICTTRHLYEPRVLRAHALHLEDLDLQMNIANISLHSHTISCQSARHSCNSISGVQRTRTPPSTSSANSSPTLSNRSHYSLMPWHHSTRYVYL